jgi:exosortase
MNRDRESRGAVDLAAGAAIGAALASTYGSIATRLVRQWLNDDTSSHGLLVVPVAIYLAWQRRAAVLTAARRPAAYGFAVIAAGLAILVVGTLGAELFLARVSFVVVLAGAVLFLLGPAHLQALRVPLLFLLLAIPIPAIVLNAITFPLQLLASQAGEAVIRAAGVPVIREGNVIELASMRLEVVEACSGIRSVMALLACACFAISARPTKPTTAAAVLAATVPVAIAANALRVAMTGLVAQFVGPSVATGALHSSSGVVVFVAAATALLALERSFRRFERPRACA